MTFDDAARREEAANPETFAVERRSLWRSSQQAYIRPGFIEGLLLPWRGATLQMQHIGRLGRVYAAHADPSVSQANFGFAIAHIEMDDDGIEHVVYDLLHAWRPVDFEAGWVNYPLITDQIFDYVKAFNIAELTYDQYSSVGEIQRLRARIIDAQLPVRTNVHQRPATAGLNFNAYEAFKTALGHGIVHAPPFALAVAELGALEMIGTKVVCQTTGPVTTKDVADAMVQVFWTLLGHRSADLFDRLARTPLRGSQPAFGPARIREPIFDQFSEFSRSQRRGRLNGSNPARGRHRN